MLRLITTLVVALLLALFTVAYGTLTGDSTYTPRGHGRHARNGRHAIVPF